jgi:hypothetical protein
MASENSKPTALELHPGWNLHQTEKLREPSIWPASFALASTFLVWGLVTSLIITGVGIMEFGVALAGWIRAIRSERIKQ